MFVRVRPTRKSVPAQAPLGHPWSDLARGVLRILLSVRQRLGRLCMAVRDWFTDLRAIRDCSATPETKHLLLVLYTFCRQDSCWPSQETLSAALGVKVRSVQLRLADAKEAGWVRVEQRWAPNGQTSNRYILNVDPLRRRTWVHGRHVRLLHAGRQQQRTRHGDVQRSARPGTAPIFPVVYVGFDRGAVAGVRHLGWHGRIAVRRGLGSIQCLIMSSPQIVVRS